MSDDSGMVLRIATRASPLARWQAEHVAALLHAKGASVEVVTVETEGDRDRTRPIAELAGRGVFAKEVQGAVLDGRADLAVHSAKDLTSTPTDGLAIAAVIERGDPRDVLIGAHLADIAEGAVIATGSIRRQAQLAHLRPDIRFVGLRGNIDTRVARVGTDAGLGDGSTVAAIVGAAAAMERLGIDDRVAQWFEPDEMIPQVAQGAIAVECRDDDDTTLAALAAINHIDSELCVRAERAYLGELGGGCDLPVGAFAEIHGVNREGEAQIVMTALLSSHDGTDAMRTHGVGTDPETLGRALAGKLLDEGGRTLLASDFGRE